MASVRLTLRFDLSQADDRRAWEFLHRDGAGSCKAEVISLINAKLDTDLIRDTIQTTLQSMLQGNLTTPMELGQDESTEQELLDFLDAF